MDALNNPNHAYTSPTLERAIEQWERGNTIPLTLAIELMAEGFDVEALEAEYRN